MDKICVNTSKRATEAGANGGRKRSRPEPVRVQTRRVWAGTGEVEAGELCDSTAAFQAEDWPSLRSRLAEEGYLFLRGVLDRQAVLEARKFVLQALHEFKPHIFLDGTSPAAAQAAQGTSAVGLLGRQDIANADPVKTVLEAGSLFDLMETIFESSEVVTTGFKWLRAVAPTEFTGVHTDRVFLGRGSPRLLTAWLPLGDCPVEQGTMMLIPESQTMPELSDIRSSYGKSEVGKDGTRSGWLTDNGQDVEAWVHKVSGSSGSASEAAPRWFTADFKAGDVILLRLDVLHMSAANRSNCLRISCDTRWLPADELRDPRLAVWNKRPTE